MIDFLQIILSKTAAFVTSAIIATGMISAPPPQNPVMPISKEVIQKELLEKYGIKPRETMEVVAPVIAEEVATLRKEVEVLKKEAVALKKKPVPIRTIAKTSTLKSINNQKIQQQISSPVTNSVLSNIFLCGQYWIPCQAGQKIFCFSAGGARCLLENAELQGGLSPDLMMKFSIPAQLANNQEIQKQTSPAATDTVPLGLQKSRDCTQWASEKYQKEKASRELEHEQCQKEHTGISGLVACNVELSLESFFSACMGTRSIRSDSDNRNEKRRLEELERRQEELEQEQKKLENQRYLDCSLDGGYYLNGSCRHL